MRWASQDWFAAGIVIIIILLWTLRHGFLARRKILDSFADEGLQTFLVPERRLVRRRKAMVFCVAAVLLATAALMRPQWGSRWEKVPRIGIDLLIVLDISNSMLSEDILPSRLERAKLTLGDLVNKMGGDRVGLVAFSGDAYLACPLTPDYGGFLLTLRDLTPETIGRPGTNITRALKEAGKAFASASSPDKSLILITDGEDHGGGALAAAKKLHAAQGVRIYTVGVGTQEGELIPIRDKTGKIRFLKNKKGATVTSRLDETLLEEIALATKGVYVRSTATQFGLEILYNNYLSHLQKTRGEERTIQVYTERFALFIILALFCLIAQGIFEGLS